jgi:hypothetical protein
MGALLHQGAHIIIFVFALLALGVGGLVTWLRKH